MKTDKYKTIVAEETGCTQAEATFELPPQSEPADLAISVFRQAKAKGMPPPELAKRTADALKKAQGVADAVAVAGYVNITLDYEHLFESVKQILEEPSFGVSQLGRGKRVMVEFFSPNTNKPLHVGHLRNLFTGEAVSNLLEYCGYEVVRANLYNDRGIHISKAQLAYSKWGKSSTPAEAGKKGDHFVGDYYVLFSSKAEQDPDLEEEAQRILRLWEADDQRTRADWKVLRDWVIQGVQETLSLVNTKPFDVNYWESEFWQKGVEIAKIGIGKGTFRQALDGAVVVDVPGHGEKPILRADGTALYITQDIYLALRKFQEYGPLEKSIYIVAAEQEDHFKVLFHVLKSMGFEWADSCYHLGYGLILIKGGKLKSREGITADADQIVGYLEEMALREVNERYPELVDIEKQTRSIKTALAALKWDFLKIGTLKNINFDPTSSLSLKGDTGPYLLYAYARTRALIRRAQGRSPFFSTTPPSTVLKQERQLAASLHLFPDVVLKAAQTLNFSNFCAYLYNLSENFSRYYQSHRILGETEDVSAHRLALSAAVGSVLKSGLNILGIEVLEEL